MYRKSKYNIVSKITDSDSYFLINSLTGNADVLTPEEYQAYTSGNVASPEDYQKKGYFIDEKEESALYKEKYLEFLDVRDTDEIQLFFVSTYACNFKCSYCYQDGYNNKNEKLQHDIIDSFFKYITTKFVGRKKYITLFGGEPLLNTKVNKQNVQYFIRKSIEHNLDISIVTNGYYLSEFIPILKKGKIREIQITLDGLAEMHDNRRFIKKGEGTFSKIVEGIDLCLENNISVNLRMVLDQENIADLPGLSRFAIEKGWTKNSLFKTQLGRNYELHYCQDGNSKLYTRIGLYSKIYELLKENPEIAEFHKPAFTVAKYLFDNGELPSPLFDACPGCKTEWAFDFKGDIYSCTATVGKPGEKLGVFYPEVFLDEDAVEKWEDRDVLSISACKECNLQLVCGGGCASIAQNQTGDLHGPDCRPVKEILEMGMSYYFEDLLIEDNK